MLEFAQRLPAVRRRTVRLLGTTGLTRERVHACAIRLLDLGFFRVGSEAYTEENDTFGLATLRKSHVKTGRSCMLEFDYPSKGGARRLQSVVDPAVYGAVRELKSRRGGGHELLAFRQDGVWVDVTSDGINEFLRELAGGPYTAKDFRTWNATVLAALSVAAAGETGRARNSGKRCKAEAVREVASYLGNTPAVCRASYIDPRVFDRFDGGATVAGRLVEAGRNGFGADVKTQNAIDRAVLALLED
jgi:DNA topoisomerase IB